MREKAKQKYIWQQRNFEREKKNEQKELRQKFSKAIQKELYLVIKEPGVSLQTQLDTCVGKMHH